MILCCHAGMAGQASNSSTRPQAPPTTGAPMRRPTRFAVESAVRPGTVPASGECHFPPPQCRVAWIDSCGSVVRCMLAFHLRQQNIAEIPQPMHFAVKVPAGQAMSQEHCRSTNPGQAFLVHISACSIFKSFSKGL